MKTGLLKLKMPKNKGKKMYNYKKRKLQVIKFRNLRIRSKIWMKWKVSAYFEFKFLKLR